MKLTYSPKSAEGGVGFHKDKGIDLVKYYVLDVSICEKSFTMEKLSIAGGTIGMMAELKTVAGELSYLETLKELLNNIALVK